MPQLTTVFMLVGVSTSQPMTSSRPLTACGYRTVFFPWEGLEFQTTSSSWYITWIMKRPFLSKLPLDPPGPLSLNTLFNKEGCLHLICAVLPLGSTVEGTGFCRWHVGPFPNPWWFWTCQHACWCFQAPKENVIFSAQVRGFTGEWKERRGHPTYVYWWWPDLTHQVHRDRGCFSTKRKKMTSW